MCFFSFGFGLVRFCSVRFGFARFDSLSLGLIGLVFSFLFCGGVARFVFVCFLSFKNRVMWYLVWFWFVSVGLVYDLFFLYLFYLHLIIW